MFGIIRPCRHRLTEQLHQSWMAHLCGLCLALRDDHGQLARTATNYDGLLVSVLVEAQSTAAPGSGRRKAGPCPLRGMRTAPVARGEGARLAAAVSLALASAKFRDHVEDADGLYARRPVALAAGGVADRWGRQSRSGGSALGFDTGMLFDTLAEQPALERAAGPGSSVLLVTAPTEHATSLALEHTAVLAGRPGNRIPLAEIGRLFGRLAHLLDAVEDLAADRATGAWNPLTATGTPLAEAERLCHDAVHGIRLALRDAEFTDPALAHRLLAHETDAAVRRTFAHAATGPFATSAWGPSGQPGPHGPGSPFGPGRPGDQAPYGYGPAAVPPVRRNPLVGCAMWALLCCTCQACCREEFEDPCTGKRREGGCRDCDCDCTDCCDCDGGCCDCCDCCDCSC